MKLRYLTSLIVALFCFVNAANAQYSAKKVKSKHQAYTDSLKSYEYNYLFPIWGQGAYKKGFDIPYPGGVMGNFIWMQQSILIEDFQLGVTTDSLDIPLTPVDELLKFGKNSNTSWAANVRPDLWVFPFLNVYGLFGGGVSTTEINLVNPIPISTSVTQDLRTAGVGVMTAFGVGPVWISIDGNWTWNKAALLDKAVRVNVLGVRFGHTFTFKNRPDRNFAIWAGGMRAKMESETVGKITLAEALPSLGERSQEIVDNYNEWYAELDPNNPIDKRIMEKADEVLQPIVDRIEAADGSTVIKYGMSKQVAEMWNGVVGVQFQLNKNWMFRSEGGIIGDRKSWLISANYRFKI